MMVDCMTADSERAGLDMVGINEPYSNSETPECPFQYQSMMLEVNKKTYMEDGSLHLKTNNAYRRSVHELMITLLSQLSN
jgi:hypothetical protein